MTKTHRFHSGQDLLANARSLGKVSHPSAHRLVVIEAMTAVEVFVNSLIRDALNAPVTHEFAVWLRNSKNMHFEKRVQLLAPFATGLPSIPKESTLWKELLHARETRNGIVHSGNKANSSDAQQAITAAQAIIDYFTTTAQLRAAIASIDDWLAKQSRPVHTPQDAASAVLDYFRKITHGQREVRIEPGARDSTTFTVVIAEQRIQVVTRLLYGDSSLGAIAQAQEQIRERANREAAAVAAFVFIPGPLPDCLNSVHAELLPGFDETSRVLYSRLVSTTHRSRPA